MNLKFNYNYIYILIFTSFFFFWGVNLEQIKLSYILPHNHEYYNFFNNIKLSYSIIFLLIPIFYSYMKKRTSSFKQIYNYQRYIMFFFLFIVAHFFLVKFYYHVVIDKSEIANLFYLLILSLIYCHYRNFILVNLKKIIIFYLIIFIIYSIYDGSQIFHNGLYNIEGVLYFKNVGQCNNDIFLIDLLGSFLNTSLSNSIYLENSHLAMMTIPVLFSSLYIFIYERKKNILFLLLFLMQILILLNNLSTTYFVAYFASMMVLLLFFFNKINIKFLIIGVIFLIINSYLFFADKQCSNKVTDFKIKKMMENSTLLYNKTSEKTDRINLTTLVYQRSVLVAKETVLHHSLGWGIDGMNNANKDLMIRYRSTAPIFKETTLFWQLRYLNLKDGLTNLLKLFTEFGVFAFIIYFYFLKYLLNIKNINSYNLFIIVLFITLSIRGAGYFNGGFIFCVLEFFYQKKFTDNKS